MNSVIGLLLLSVASAWVEAPRLHAQSHVLVDGKRRTTDEKWTPQPTTTLRHLPDFDAGASDIELSQYGGRKDRRVDATGFFRVQKVADRWWFVDPEGYLWYSVGCCSVRFNPTHRGQAALKQRFADAEGWARHTARLLASHGFNTLGCWSWAEHFQTVQPRIPYTTQTNFMSSYGKLRGGTYQKPGHTGYTNDCIFVFDPKFEEFCRRHAKKQLAATKGDPWLLGHFSDNELPFRDDSLDRYLSLEPADPGRTAAQRWVEQHHIKADSSGSYSDEDRAAFLEFLSATYFRIVSQAIRDADPNHLYLGARFHGSVLRYASVFRGCGPYVDVVSCNYYGAWTPNPERLASWVEWSGRPFIVTEWYAKGMDSGMANISGAGWTVKTQKDRGRFYQNFTLGLLHEPGCIGWHWFKYIDNDPTDTKADPSNRDSNKGMVSSLYEPYPDLLEMMRELNGAVYALRDALSR
jgi:hypothetical protein